MFASALPYAITAGAGLLGSWFSNQSNRDIADDTNWMNYQMMLQNQQFSSAQAARNMAFQERMSNTSWQRGVADMKAAGVNPMLAFSKGGAAVPSGAMGSSAPVAAVTGAPMVNVVSSAIQALSALAEIDNLRANTALVRSTTPGKGAKAGLDDRIYSTANKVIDKVQPVVERHVSSVASSAVSSMKRRASLLSSVYDHFRKRYSGYRPSGSFQIFN